MSFCTLTLTFLCSLGGQPVSYSTKQNPLVYQSLTVSSKSLPFELGCLTYLNFADAGVKCCSLS